MKQTCQRCAKPAIATIMSRFNTQQICLDCEEAEKKRSDYKMAADAEIEACRRGDFNFPGIGLK